MRVLMLCSFVIWEIVPIYGSCSALWRCIPLSKLNPMRSSSRRASSTIWMQACKRCAARAVNLASVETNCIKCSQVIMVASSVTLVQEYERFSLPKDQVYPQSVQTRFWTGKNVWAYKPPWHKQKKQNLCCHKQKQKPTLCSSGMLLPNQMQIPLHCESFWKPPPKTARGRSGCCLPITRRRFLGRSNS